MTLLARSTWKDHRILALALLGFALAIFSFVIRGAFSRPAEHVVTLVAEDVKFNESNPPIRVKAGEQVTIILENREIDPIPHNLQVTGFGVNLGMPVQPGHKATLTFSANQPGTYIYQCPLHPGSMDGQFIVEP